MGVFDNTLIPKRSIKGIMLDKMVKAIFLNAVSYADGVTHDVAEEKNKNGWINPEIKILYDIFTEIIEQDERMRNKGEDHVRDLYTGLRNVVCVTLDEDSHYLLRFFLFCDLLNEHREEFAAAHKKNKWITDWERMREELKKDKEKREAGIKDADPNADRPISVIMRDGPVPRGPKKLNTMVDNNDTGDKENG